ncbi:MAG: CAP domain-containing protein, partial [Oscillospiraceae bacterium]
GWMNSKGHRANILRKDFTYLGVGHHTDANGAQYWVQLFCS